MSGFYNGFAGEQRDRAQRWLRDAWSRGTLPRPSQCIACGQRQGAIHAHAEDYSEPFGPHLQGFELCYLCHIVLHCRFRNAEAWHRYCAAVASGCTFDPASTFGEVVAFIGGRTRPFVVRESPRLLVLDAIERGSALSTTTGRLAPVTLLGNDEPRLASPALPRAGQLGLFGPATKA